MVNLNENQKTFLAELIGGFTFSTSYYLWMGRAASDFFDLGFLDLAMAVGLSYLAAVFISSYDYRADVFPFFSLFRCFAEKSLSPLYINISGQLVGTLTGFAAYSVLKASLLKNSPFASKSLLTQITVDNEWIIYGLFAALVAILTYFIALVRRVFVMSGMSGSLIIALISYVVSAITIPFHGLSVPTMLPDAILYLMKSSVSASDFVDVIFFGLITIGVAFLTFIKIRDHRVVVFFKEKSAQDGTN